MAVTPIPDAPVVPQYPALGSLTFNQEAYAYGTAMPGVTLRLHEIAVAARANAVDAAQSASAANLSSGQSAASATLSGDWATAAGASASSAALSRDSALSSATFAGKLNLGNHPVAPTTDREGDPILVGATYYDTTLDKVRVYGAAGWTDGISAVAGVSSFNGQTGDVAFSPVNLQGDTTPYVTQVKTYTITNYNSFSSYAVSASAGAASLSGDTITFTAPTSAGSVSLTLTVDGQPTVFTLAVQPAGVATPSNTSPADGAVNIGPSPTLQSSAFTALDASDTHQASRWTLYQDGTQVHSSGWSTSALTSYTVPVGVLSVSTPYTWTVEHQGTTLGDSSPSAATSFTTAAAFVDYIPTPTATPANFGDPLEGGFYAGMVWNELVQTATSTTIGTGSKTFTVPNMTSAPIVYGGQTIEVRSRANPANKMVGTVTGAVGTNLTINVTSVGGSGTFTDWSIMSRYRVIVAPKASGENASIALKNANTALPTACQTLTEGLRATQSMRDADTSTVYPAAHWARNLNIGGRTDWYIPARDELELCWRNLKPDTNSNYTTADRPISAGFSYENNGSYGDTASRHGANNNSAPAGLAYTGGSPAQTAATAFRTGGAEAFEFGTARYWSSSDYDASAAWFHVWNSSTPGGQNIGGKETTYRVRAVRRSII